MRQLATGFTFALIGFFTLLALFKWIGWWTILAAVPGLPVLFLVAHILTDLLFGAIRKS